MELDVPRAAQWSGEIPNSSCFDDKGPFMVEEPMSMAFNIIPRNTQIPVIINYLKSNGGLNDWVRCLVSHPGTVFTEARRQVSLVLRDADVARLIEGLKSQPHGFVIYDLKKTELFSNTVLLNHVAENAPDQSDKFLFLPLCFDFQEASDVLDNSVQDNHKSREKLGILTYVFMPCILSASWFICDSMKKKYKLVNKRPYPRVMTMTLASYGGIVLNM